MSAPDQPDRDRYLAPGTPVRLDSLAGENDDIISEYGVVVQCWRNTELQFYDCYVAFFGKEMPKGEPSEKPYILRYASTSLTQLDSRSC